MNVATRKKVLLVEDDEILGELIHKTLVLEDYDVRWEKSGVGVAQLASTDAPDLILLDLVMPQKSGYEVLEELATVDTLRKIPVVIISNSGQPVELTKVLKMGARDYIIKAEFSPEEILKKVHTYLGTGTPSPEPHGKVSHAKILVAEDDKFLFSLIAERLVKEGYTVLSGSDGVEAMQVLEEEMPDLVIMDIVMPRMNGFELLKRVKSQPKFKDLLVIVFSNLGQDHEIEEAKSLGANEFLIKAKFTLKELLEKISVLLEKRTASGMHEKKP